MPISIKENVAARDFLTDATLSATSVEPSPLAAPPKLNRRPT
jgi:hypothetical protein